MNYESTRKSVKRTSTSLERSAMRCAHCDRTMNNFAGGYSRSLQGKPLCHPNGPNRPNCYKLVTLYGHSLPCKRKKCYEDHPNLTDYIGRQRVKVQT
jgi:hypothetical protein